MLIPFYGHLPYLRTFGIFPDYLEYFPHFGMLQQDKSGNPASPTFFASGIFKIPSLFVFTRWQLGIHFQRADFGHWTLACDQQ
jgi:hypothetical protein